MLLQLVLNGQKTVEIGHGHGGREAIEPSLLCHVKFTCSLKLEAKLHISHFPP